MADVEALAREVLAQRAAGASAHAVFSLPRGAPLADVRARYKKARAMLTTLRRRDTCSAAARTRLTRE